MNMKEVIGVDLGGTNIKMGRFTPTGDCLESLTIPTPQPSTPAAVVEAISHGVNRLNRHKQALALGVGTPGPADATGRIALVAINLTDWHNVPLAELLEAKTGLATVIANDANCAGLAEAWLGAGKGHSNLVLLTLGTGVGGAIILNGKLFTGHLGAAGELGLITLNPDGPPCNSGNQGSLEQYVSATAIIRETGKKPASLALLAEKNDPEALTFWQNYGRRLGAGLASIIYVLTPEVVIIGGGICKSAKYFLPATIAEVEKRVLPSSRVGLKITVAQLGEKAGMVGAAFLAWQTFFPSQ
ncbi:MAG: ROK family protein [Geminocystis sp.]|nr:ROK family protein [Geminocystis sp.]MCS7147011.1 ROK family protein [Geminocystis sp.]